MKIISSVIGLIFFICLLSFSCDEEVSDGENFDVVVTLVVVNDEGENMLDSATASFFPEEDIALYYQSGHDFIDSPNGFLYMHGSQLNIYPDFHNNESIPDHVVKWSESESDTLSFEVYMSKSGGLVRIDKVWVNGQITWEDNGFNSRVITLVK